MPHISVRSGGWVIIPAMLFENSLIFVLKGLLVTVVCGLASCVVDQPAPSMTVTKFAELIPYSSPTPSETSEIKIPSLIVPTKLPPPTSTPVIYIIVEGDTMLAISIRHGISLEELQAANPEVNARLLVVGTELVIPLGDNIPSSPVTATPIPIKISGTNCYPAPDGIWCFISIANDRTRPLENISAQVLLHNNSGGFIAEGTAIGAINLLPPGEEFPLVVFFPGSHSSEIIATINILTGHPIPRNDARYLNAWLEIDEVVMSEGGLQAEVLGTVGLPAKSQPGNLVWILVIAYDSDGNVVGVRKDEQIGHFEPGSSKQFDIEVFSLHSSISDIKAFVEVRP